MGKWRLVGTAWWRRQLVGGRLVGLLAMLVMLTLRGADPPLFEVIRARTFDMYQTLRPRPSPAERPVVIVDLDEASLTEVGQWPWPRTVLARMVDSLTAAGAAVIGFDIVFAEPDRMSPASLAAVLPDLDQATRLRLAAAKSNDQILAEAMGRSRVVVGQAGSDQAKNPSDGLPHGPTIVRIGGDPRPLLDHTRSILRNVPEIDSAAAGWGVFSVTPEADGVVRRVPAVLTDGQAIYPALSLEMLRLATANENLAVKTGPDGVIGVIVRPNLVATDARGDIWLYAARHDPDKFISAKEVVAGRFDPRRVAGRLVLIGTSAIGLQDIRSTAVERVIPGVELHAQIIETILSGMQLSNPPNAAGVEMIAAMAGALLMIILVPIIGARWTLALFLVAAGGLTGASWVRFTEQRLLYDPVFPVTTTLLVFILVTYASYAREEARKRQVRSAFSRYMSPVMVERLAADPGLLRLGGDTREMTLLFCDVRGFTTISEQFDAQGLIHMINRFLTAMTDAILDRRGTIDKYMGDCIMAFWNAPLDDADHAANACRAALAMQDRLGPLNADLAAEAAAGNRRHLPIVVGIGLNSGPAVVGNMGSDQRFDYSVLGDTVNLASRLEGQSKVYGVTVVISEETRRRAPGFATVELDWIRVKGKTEAAQIHALLGDGAMAAGEPFQALAACHRAMLEAYRAQDWPRAREKLAASRGLDPGLRLDTLFDLYDDRLDRYERTPPGAGWDGVFVATTK